MTKILVTKGRNFPLIITAAASYGISGKVTNGGQGLANVTVSYSGASNGSTTTDASGNYSLNSLAGGGDYTITATLTNATFAQPSIVFNDLNANFTDINFATAPTTYEGDIAGRPTGDGAINVLDLVSLGRIINNLDAPPTIGAEWQRADIAPRSTLGNGIVDTNDLTQMRNYIVGNNLRTISGGAISSAIFALRKSPPEKLTLFRWSAKGYSFNSQVINITEDISDLKLVAQARR